MDGGSDDDAEGTSAAAGAISAGAPGGSPTLNMVGKCLVSEDAASEDYAIPTGATFTAEEGDYLFLSLDTIIDVTRASRKWLVVVLKCEGRKALVAAKFVLDGKAVAARVFKATALVQCTDSVLAETAAAEFCNDAVEGDEVVRRSMVEVVAETKLMLELDASLQTQCPTPAPDDALGCWRGMLGLDNLRQGLTLEDTVPPRRVPRRRVAFDVEAELRLRVSEAVDGAAAAYDAEEAEGALSGDRDAQQKHLRTSLEKDAKLHSFRLALAPSLQRVIRKKFAAQPKTSAEESEHVADCYTHLMTLANAHLQGGDAAGAARQTFEAELAALKHVADDVEASGNLCRSLQLHKKSLARVRSRVVTPNDGGVERAAHLAMQTWLEYAQFALRVRGSEARCRDQGTFGDCTCVDAALEALKCARACAETDGGVYDAGMDEEFKKLATHCAVLHGAILLDQGRLDEAVATLHSALLHGADAESARRISGRESLEAAEIVFDVPTADALTAALLCCALDARSDGAAARRALELATQALPDGDGAFAKGTFVEGTFDGLYNLHAPAAALFCAAAFLADGALADAADHALSLADRAQSVARQRSPGAPAALDAFASAARARLLVLRDAHKDAVELVAGAADAAGLVVLGDALKRIGRVSESIQPYASALRLLGSDAPLLLAAQHARALSATGAHSDAASAFVAAARKFEACSLWLGAGVSALRLGQRDRADRLLRLASVRDSSNPAPHAYLALVHLTFDSASDGAAEGHASEVLELALRLGLDDAGVLRELGNAYFEKSKFATAEALFRRAVVAPNIEPGAKVRPFLRGSRALASFPYASRPQAQTRKRLGDVLAAQHATEDAIAEYERALLTAEGADALDIRASLQGLLVSVGRSADIAD
ncbi:hypothetical protein M885DRAFT_109222 [Pelagophyceae sp. CCMP2097]|nr:hypothetical protein M885DRAFT_109222 [Pelagophyceae sp. CCMP2097]